MCSLHRKFITAWYLDCGSLDRRNALLACILAIGLSCLNQLPEDGGTFILSYDHRAHRTRAAYRASPVAPERRMSAGK
jgi:hypothetical protein